MRKLLLPILVQPVIALASSPAFLSGEFIMGLLFGTLNVPIFLCIQSFRIFKESPYKIIGSVLTAFSIPLPWLTLELAAIDFENRWFILWLPSIVSLLIFLLVRHSEKLVNNS